ncbi:MAG: cytochrome c oxidase subunit II [Conexibacter sp.]
MPLAVERPYVLEPRGEDAHVLGQEITFQLVVGGLVLLLVLGLLVAIVIRQLRHRTPEEAPPDLDEERGQRWIVLGGLVLPLVVLTAVVVMSARSFLAVDDAGGARAGVERTVEVVAHRWWWEVRYPDAHASTANEVVLPVGQPVRLRLRTKDVIHSLWIPQLDRKADMIPGRVTYLRLTAERPGEYRGLCAEFCGLQHAKMAFRVRVLAPGAFADWLAAARLPAARPATTSARAGARVFQDAGCAVCHTIAGTAASGEVGPELTHLASRRSIAAETLPNTRGNLAGWISDPQHVKRGVLMPRTELGGRELQQLLDYLEGLR